MNRKMTFLPAIGLRGCTERVLFACAVVGCFLWYFQEKETYRFWRSRAGKLNAELLGFATPVEREYSSEDAAGDWVAFATGQGLLTGFSDPGLKGIDFTRGKLSDGQLQSLSAALPDPLPPSNTPLTIKYCISGAAHGQRQDHPGWLSFKAEGGFAALLFRFENPLVMAKMPRLVVVAQPAAAFDNTPVRFFWRGPDAKQPVTERVRSMTGYFRTQGDVAVALLPLGRLVEWTKWPLAGMIRMDVTPKASEGRIRMISLGARP